MSLATRLERAIAEREESWCAYSARKSGAALARYQDAEAAVTEMLDENESAILAALKFQEAVERHKISVGVINGVWAAFNNDHHRTADTPAAAVASLVAELEKK